MRFFIFTVFSLLLISCSTQNDSKQVVSSSQAPAAIGPYSQAIISGKTVYLSGQLGIIPETGKLAEGFEAQSRQALGNCKVILEEAGYTMEDVVRCQVFLVDMSDYKTFNNIYKEFFTLDFPARAVVEVSELPAGGLVEIMMEEKK